MSFLSCGTEKVNTKYIAANTVISRPISMQIVKALFFKSRNSFFKLKTLYIDLIHLHTLMHNIILAKRGILCLANAEISRTV